MADDQERVVTSDAEGPEKRTRKQLEKATISKAHIAAASASGDVDVEGVTVEGSSDISEDTAEPARLRKKRSHEEISDPQSREAINANARHHTRKRSRDSNFEEDVINNGQRKSGERVRGDAEVESTSNGTLKAPPSDRARTPEQTGEKRGEGAVEEMSSPKIKRSRLHPDPDPSIEEQNLSEDTSAATTVDPPKEDKATPKVPPTSGFANTSVASPFASLAGAKSPKPEAAQTSSSAFAASAFGSLAGSTTSGFGAVGKSSGGFGTGGGFASGSTMKEEKPESSSLFGGVLGQKSVFATTAPAKESTGFGSSASGFGKLGSGSAFGGTGFSSLGSSGGLTSFASGKPSSSLAGPSKPAKSFGGPADDEEEDLENGTAGENDDDAGFRSPLSQESDKQDERFYRQDLETGEEDEHTEYSCRAKLYNFAAGPDSKKEWKECGLGTVRLNVKKPAGGEEDVVKPTARLLMRADGSHRVILNTAVTKSFKFGGPDGLKPQGGYIHFGRPLEGKAVLEPMQLKVNVKWVADFYDKVVELQESM